MSKDIEGFVPGTMKLDPVEHYHPDDFDTMDVYYLGGPFGGWVGRFPSIDGVPMAEELPVVAEDSDSRVEGAYVLDGEDIEGRPLFRWEQREAPAPDPDD